METREKFLGIVLALLAGAILVLACLTGYNEGQNASQTDTGSPTPDIAVCELEDGSTQAICWWHDDANGDFLNIDYGRYTYVPLTGDLIDWKE